MEEAKQNFETMVGLAERKLDNIEKKIDDKLVNHLNSDEDRLEGDDTLLGTLDEVKAEYKSLCQEAAQLNQAQKQMAQAFQQELLAQVKQLQMIQDKGLFSEPDSKTQVSLNTVTTRLDGSNTNVSQSMNDSKPK